MNAQLSTQQLRTERISQTAMCCGHGYWRWRFTDRKFKKSRRCDKCGKYLHWVDSPKTRKARDRRRYELLRYRYEQQGLTAMGRPRRRRGFLPSDQAERKAIIAAQVRAYQQRRKAKLRALGLTVKKTPFKSSYTRYMIFRESLALKPGAHVADMCSRNKRLRVAGIDLAGGATS
jgi:hypothetical protein